MSAWLKILESGTLTDRTDYLSAVTPPSFDLQRGVRGTATVPLHVPAADTYVPAIGWQIFLYEDNGSAVKCVFAGSIDTVTLTWDDDLGERNYALTCVAFEQCFDTLLISPRVYPAGAAWGTVISDILSTTCAGVPVSAGTISAGANLAADLVLSNDVVSDIFDQGAQNSGFIWYVDPDALQVNFCLTTTVAAPFTLAAADILWGTIEWDQSRVDFRNRQIVRHAFEATNPSVDYFLGDGVTTVFTLTYPIVKGVRAILTQSTIASVLGTLTGQPNPGDTVTIGGDARTFVTALDNTSAGSQVIIGPTPDDTLQNLIDDINAEPSRAGIGFNLAESEQGGTNAGGAAGGSFTLRAKAAGSAFNSIAVSATGTAFSWASGTLTGGTGDGATDVALNIQLDRSGSVPPDPQDLIAATGSTTITLATAPPSDRALSIFYYRLGSDCAAVEDTALVIARAAIEGGTGKYQQIIDDSQLTDKAEAALEAQAALSFYKIIPVTFKFQTDKSGLMPGETLTIAITGAPVYAPALVARDWLVQEVQGDLIPGVDFLRTDGGHFRYTVSVINTTVIGTDIQFWKQLASGGSSGGGGSTGGGGGSGIPTALWGIDPMTIIAGAVTPVLTTGYSHEVTATGNLTVNAATGGVAGQPFEVKIKQDATGGRLITWDAAYVGLADCEIRPLAGSYTIVKFTVEAGGVTFRRSGEFVTGIL